MAGASAASASSTVMRQPRSGQHLRHFQPDDAAADDRDAAPSGTSARVGDDVPGLERRGTLQRQRPRPRAGGDHDMVGREVADRRRGGVDAAAHGRRPAPSPGPSARSRPGGPPPCPARRPPGGSARRAAPPSPRPRPGGRGPRPCAPPPARRRRRPAPARAAGAAPGASGRLSELRLLELGAEHRVGHAGDVAFQGQPLEADIAGDAGADRRRRWHRRPCAANSASAVSARPERDEVGAAIGEHRLGILRRDDAAGEDGGDADRVLDRPCMGLQRAARHRRRLDAEARQRRAFIGAAREVQRRDAGRFQHPRQLDDLLHRVAIGAVFGAGNPDPEREVRQRVAQAVHRLQQQPRAVLEAAAVVVGALVDARASGIAGTGSHWRRATPPRRSRPATAAARR